MLWRLRPTEPLRPHPTGGQAITLREYIFETKRHKLPTAASCPGLRGAQKRLWLSSALGSGLPREGLEEEG